MQGDVVPREIKRKPAFEVFKGDNFYDCLTQLL